MIGDDLKTIFLVLNKEIGIRFISSYVEARQSNELSSSTPNQLLEKIATNVLSTYKTMKK